MSTHSVTGCTHRLSHIHVVDGVKAGRVGQGHDLVRPWERRQIDIVGVREGNSPGFPLTINVQSIDSIMCTLYVSRGVCAHTCTCPCMGFATSL